jgi:DNA-binding transcriptional ArsR family regulator
MAEESLEVSSMSPDDSDDIVEQALEQLLEAGYIEVCGINEEGRWLYRATEKGIGFYEAAIEIGIAELLEGIEKDVE